MISKGAIYVDLDGTLAVQEEPYDPLRVGPPIRPMCDRVRRWLEEGHEVVIFTARASRPMHSLSALAIKLFCHEQFGRVLPITAIKSYEAMEFWDDRSVQVEKNTGRIIGYDFLNL